MTTSSDNTTPSDPRPEGAHWTELTATLPRESTEVFGQWLSDDLDLLTEQLERFASPRSILKDIKR